MTFLKTNDIKSQIVLQIGNLIQGRLIILTKNYTANRWLIEMRSHTF